MKSTVHDAKGELALCTVRFDYSPETNHYAIDIAGRLGNPIFAADHGVIVYAGWNDYGYGEMIVIDHGSGWQTLYAHLSQINVNPGDTVDKSTVLGLTGTTGMAGGDHLHFSMLVHGIFVTPKEWWDQHWIEVTIEEPITDSKF